MLRFKVREEVIPGKPGRGSAVLVRVGVRVREGAMPGNPGIGTTAGLGLELALGLVLGFLL